MWEDRAGLARCLAALLAQLDATCELIVAAGVDPAPEDTADSRVRWVRAPAAALIPELWSRGMELAQGNVVAITTSHF